MEHDHQHTAQARSALDESSPLFIHKMFVFLALTIASGAEVIYIEPEFGPAPYLQALPYTNVPVADLWQINSWVHQRVRVSEECAWWPRPSLSHHFISLPTCVCCLITINSHYRRYGTLIQSGMRRNTYGQASIKPVVC